MTREYAILTLKAVIRYLKYRPIPKAEGERVIIAGNGPSLKDAIVRHKDLLKSHPLFCVNFFANSQEYTDLKPLYYGMMDPGLSQNECRTELRKRREDLFNVIENNTDWDMHLFFPLFPGQLILEETFPNPHLRLHICNILFPFKAPFLRNYIYKTGLLMPPPQNILVSAIYLCLNMGYKEIYLLGAEHSWTHDIVVKADNITYGVQRHFSGTPTEAPLYRGHSGKTWKMHELMYSFYKCFRSYHLLREYANYREATVFNCTPDSLIDAFERKQIDMIT